MLANWCYKKGWWSDIWKQILVVALALACFATAQSLHGSGYIAAFVGGLLFGRLAGHDTHDLVFAAEGIGELLALTTWVMFGAAVLGQAWAGMTWPIIIYSLLSLTVIRMLPMVVSLTGTGENLESKLFLAWFGPAWAGQYRLHHHRFELWPARLFDHGAHRCLHHYTMCPGTRFHRKRLGQRPGQKKPGWKNTRRSRTPV